MNYVGHDPQSQGATLSHLSIADVVPRQPLHPHNTTLGNVSADENRFQLSRNDQSPIRVLFVQHCANFTGSTISGRLAAAGFRKAGWEVHSTFSFSGPAIAGFEQMGCTTSIIPHKSWLRGGNLFRSARRIVAETRGSHAFDSVLQTFQPDVVYVNSLVSLAAVLAARRAGIPCLWHVRELFDDVGGEMKAPTFGGRRLVRFLLGRPEMRIAISQSVLDNIFGSSLPQPTAIVPNAVDDRFLTFADAQDECRKRLQLPGQCVLIGVPGTLRPMKGLPFFFEAIVKLAARRPEIMFAVTGDGQPAYVQQLRKQVRDAGLETRVHFTGMIQNMPDFYRACDIVCTPSQAEPFGRTVIEAFAIGTPVVATAVGGMRETIEHERTGLLVQYGDVTGLADALDRLIGDEPLRSTLAAAAKQEVLAKYTAAVYQSRLCEAVRSIARTPSHD